jgi:hypothetical protein
MPESARFDELGIPVLQGGEDVKCDDCGEVFRIEEFPRHIFDL